MIKCNRWKIGCGSPYLGSIIVYLLYYYCLMFITTDTRYQYVTELTSTNFIVHHVVGKLDAVDVDDE